MRIASLFVLALMGASPATHAAPAACVDGWAAGYECHRVDLLAHLDVEALGLGNLNDVWGWTDPVTGVEYALVGAVGGTAFVDVSDPANPALVGRLPAHDEPAPAPQRCKSSGASAPLPIRPWHDDPHDGDGSCGGGSLWRNVKTYADHAYIGSEAEGHGLQVFDLRQLRDVAPGDMPVTFEETAHYAGFGNSHTLIVNEQTGFLYAVGSDTYGGGPHFVDLSDPAAPQAAGGWDGDGYTHEALCVTYAGPDAARAGREICLLSNEDSLTVIDVTDKAQVRQLSRTRYAETGYTHQGWLTADQRYFFVNDELDEFMFGPRTRTLVWDVGDLDTPRLVDEYLHPTFVFDHNNYVRDGFVFQSNYTAGLVVLDGRDPLHLFEVGYFDTHPADDLRMFDGTWSNYPFFASGTVAVSDITGGLFLLAPRLPVAAPGADLAVQAGWLSETPDAQGRLVLRTTATNLGAVAATDVMVSASVGVTNHDGQGLSLGLDTAIEAVTGGPGVACTLTPDPLFAVDRTPRCRIAELAPGATLSFDISVTNAAFHAKVVIDARGVVGAGTHDPAPANNRARHTLDFTDRHGGNGGGGAEAWLACCGALLWLRRRRFPRR